jgi:hypothetical protein
VLSCIAGTLVTPGFAVYNSKDDNGGNVTVSSYVDSHGAAPGKLGVFCRGNSTVPSSLSTYYLASFFAGTNVQLIKSGTAIATATATVTASDTWYWLVLTASGSLLTVSLQRYSDSMWLNGSNTFQSAQTTCISMTDTGIAAADGAFGLWMSPGSINDTIYADNFSESAATAAGPWPWKIASRRDRQEIIVGAID